MKCVGLIGFLHCFWLSELAMPKPWTDHRFAARLIEMLWHAHKMKGIHTAFGHFWIA